MDKVRSVASGAGNAAHEPSVSTADIYHYWNELYVIWHNLWQTPVSPSERWSASACECVACVCVCLCVCAGRGHKRGAAVLSITESV